MSNRLAVGIATSCGDDYEGGAQFVPEEVSREHLETAHRLVTPELFCEGVYAGNVDEIAAEVQPLVDAGLRHVVINDISALATGGRVSDLVRLWGLVRRLRRIPVVTPR